MTPGKIGGGGGVVKIRGVVAFGGRVERCCSCYYWFDMFEQGNGDSIITLFSSPILQHKSLFLLFQFVHLIISNFPSQLNCASSSEPFNTFSIHYIIKVALYLFCSFYSFVRLRFSTCFMIVRGPGSSDKDLIVSDVTFL